jgi:hypothetical protein
MHEDMTHASWAFNLSENGLSFFSGKGLLMNMKKPWMKFCEHCVYGKVHDLSLLQASTKLEYCDYVHNAVRGATKVTSKGGPRYFVTFVGDHSRYDWIYFFKCWKAMAENNLVIFGDVV